MSVCSWLPDSQQYYHDTPDQRLSSSRSNNFLTLRSSHTIYDIKSSFGDEVGHRLRISFLGGEGGNNNSEKEVKDGVILEV